MKPSARRCALYGRKSSDEGLEQEFNSLDAQREACAAYVQSQSGEGWIALPALYDDGGISGGTMERPALKRLLAEITAGGVDVVVVYKIDRLTRSLADFARIVEIFERHEVSFVSVTQAFNTTSSMGRLTLNVLLSFAQFEREVTGERIRDKIAASKKKGMWMGGTVPLGYDLPLPGTRTLLVNAGEAEIVRRIFTEYVELGSVHVLERRLVTSGVHSKRRTSGKGKSTGGQPFSRGALFHILRNRIYLGEIRHRGDHHPGLHPAIIERALFDAVQAQLDTNARRRGSARKDVACSALTGRIFDTDGRPMSPTFAYGKGGKLYRYYVSAPLQQGRRKVPGDTAPRRISGAAIEARVSSVLSRLMPDLFEDPLTLPIAIEIHKDSLELLLPARLFSRLRVNLGPGEIAALDLEDPSRFRLSLAMQLRTRGGRTEIVAGAEAPSRGDPALIRALRGAHKMLSTDKLGMPTLTAAPGSFYRRRLIRLAFLAPDLQRAILAGHQPPALTLARLMSDEIPLAWSEQHRLFGPVASVE